MTLLPEQPVCLRSLRKNILERTLYTEHKKFKSMFLVFRMVYITYWLPIIQILQQYLHSQRRGSLNQFSSFIHKLIDNPKSDPQPAKSFALPTPIGQVVVNEPQNSITKETIQDTIFDFNIGFGITAMQSNTAGTAHTIFTTIDHGLNRSCQCWYCI